MKRDVVAETTLDAISAKIDRDVQRGRNLMMAGIGVMFVTAALGLPFLFLYVGKAGIIDPVRVPGFFFTLVAGLTGITLVLLGSVLVGWRRVDVQAVLDRDDPAGLPILLSCLHRTGMAPAEASDKIQRMRRHALALLSAMEASSTVEFSEGQEFALVALLRDATDAEQKCVLRHLSNSSRLSTMNHLRNTISYIAKYGPRPPDSAFLARFVAEARQCEALIELHRREKLPASEYLRSSGPQDNSLLRPAGERDPQYDAHATLLRPRAGGEEP